MSRALFSFNFNSFNFLSCRQLNWRSSSPNSWRVLSPLTSQFDKVAPVRHSSRLPPKPISKWLSTKAVAAKRERRRLERRWLSTRDDRDRLKYRRASRSANKLINNSRRDFFRNRLLECDNQPHDKRWRIVNDLLHSHVTDKTSDENKHLRIINSSPAKSSPC